ncbi:bifunctional tetrahydrofolate synthase/dihydrofolate synthase [Sedimenticola sp.]|uniref:bifunctional tetrahydrofolate synthase/dihydrofolate synthase n=1 Tax=Sedimenticola sp. TaxID=1940285 RepID=UPI003D0AA88C
MRFDNLEDWLNWQNTLHPQEIELGLERVTAVWQRLQSQPLTCPVITVAGTNGKGSCVAFLEAILRSASYRVGCYTSPHLVRYNERIVIDGEPVSDEQICAAFERVDQARGDATLTYFEFGTLAALDLFAAAGLDVVVLEVGLGGRLDAVNIIDADVALISTVDIDHGDWLGSTREEIGREKAGVMRAGRPVVFAGSDMPDSIRQTAAQLGAQLLLAGRDYQWRRQDQGWDWLYATHPRHSLPLPTMRGDFQLQNASAVLMTLETLRDRLPLDQRAVRIGLQEAQLPGRYQVIGRDPQVVLDVAHNAQAARALSANLGDMFCHGRTIALFSMLADKEIDQVVQIMAPRIDDWYLFALDAPRAASLPQLEQRLQEQGIAEAHRYCFDSATAAFAAAKAVAGEGDRIVAFGSFYVVGGVLPLV